MKRLATILILAMLAVGGATILPASAFAQDKVQLRMDERQATQDVVVARERLKAAEKSGDDGAIKAARKELREAKRKRDDLRAKLGKRKRE